MDYGDGETTKIPTTPMKLYGFERKPLTQEGCVGAQTEEVLEELGYSKEEIEKLKTAGAVCAG